MEPIEPSVMMFDAINPPVAAPKATTSPQRFAFQSPAKKGIFFPAPAMEHMVLRLDDMPKRFSLNSSKKSTAAMAGPPIYQGHGSKSKFIIINWIVAVF